MSEKIVQLNEEVIKGQLKDCLLYTSVRKQHKMLFAASKFEGE